MDTGAVPTRLPQPPRDRPLTVAFVLATGAEVVDFAGPWGVFEYADVPDRVAPAFELFTVADSLEPVRLSGGLAVVPDHSFTDAPVPKIVVVPAIAGDPSPAMTDWIARMAPHADLTMSVCNGAFVLAKAGLLAGRSATAHHTSLTLLAADFPDVDVRRGARFVDAGNVSTAGGLTSGVDLAIHVVERYFGKDAAERTADLLEYQGEGWRDPDSNRALVARPISTTEHPLCPVCDMRVADTGPLSETYRDVTYHFCSPGCLSRFDQTPELFVVDRS